MMALPIDLKGKVAFVSGMADPNGYGWAITKALAEAGATIVVGVWPPALKIFETNLKRGKFDEEMELADGSQMVIDKIYPQDAIYDTPGDVPDEIKTNKRYIGLGGFTISEVAAKVAAGEIRQGAKRQAMSLILTLTAIRFARRRLPPGHRHFGAFYRQWPRREEAPA
jgi:enoyl-[acyl-carrier protein] reductase I